MLERPDYVLRNRQYWDRTASRCVARKNPVR